jgi:hypothetical protein
MTLADALETPRMHRVASLTDDRLALVTTRPFRAPPHPITEVGVIVGGQVPMPGAGSRAHHGVLCLDARLECRRHVLEVLRQPLEEGVITEPPHGCPRPRRPGRHCRIGHRSEARRYGCVSVRPQSPAEYRVAGRPVVVSWAYTVMSVARACPSSVDGDHDEDLGFIPIMGGIIRFVVAIWVLITGITAIRQA